jgi:O-antigen/teichoic acid export membrane protein
VTSLALRDVRLRAIRGTAVGTRALAGRVASHARWTVGASVFYVACQALVLLVVARLGTPALVGELAMALAVAAPIALLVSLQLRSAQATDVAEEWEFADYLALRAAGMAILVLATLAIADAIALDLRVAAAVAAMKGAEGLSDVVYGRLQREERFDVAGRSQVLRGVLAVAGVAGGLAAGLGLAGGVGLVAAAWLVVFWRRDLAAVPRAAWRSTRADRATRRRALVRASLPLGLAAGAGSVAAGVPRYLLYGFADAATVGYYAALAYVVVLGALFASALGQAICPLLARSWQEARRRFVGVTVATATLVAAASALAVALAARHGAALLTVLYGEAYAAHAAAFTWLVVAGGLGAVASLLNYALTATRRFSRVLVVQLAAGAAMLVAGLVRIPAGGLLGAAQATACGSAVGLGVLIVALASAAGGRDG